MRTEYQNISPKPLEDLKLVVPLQVLRHEETLWVICSIVFFPFVRTRV